MAVSRSAGSEHISAAEPQVGLITSLWRGLIRRMETARIERELYALEDHELRDIGVSRADIPQIARNAAAENAEGK